MYGRGLWTVDWGDGDGDVEGGDVEILICGPK